MCPSQSGVTIIGLSKKTVLPLWYLQGVLGHWKQHPLSYFSLFNVCWWLQGQSIDHALIKASESQPLLHRAGTWMPVLRKPVSLHHWLNSPGAWIDIKTPDLAGYHKQGLWGRDRKPSSTGCMIREVDQSGQTPSQAVTCRSEGRKSKHRPDAWPSSCFLASSFLAARHPGQKTPRSSTSPFLVHNKQWGRVPR